MKYKYSELKRRAENLSKSILEEGRKLGEQYGLGHETAFHMAHNALLSWGTPGQWTHNGKVIPGNVLRKIQYIEQKSFIPFRLLDTMYQRNPNCFIFS
jgi:hypothetical protein